MQMLQWGCFALCVMWANEQLARLHHIPPTPKGQTVAEMFIFLTS